MITIQLCVERFSHVMHGKIIANVSRLLEISEVLIQDGLQSLAACYLSDIIDYLFSNQQHLAVRK